MSYNDIKGIIPKFRFEGVYEHSVELTSGNVNSTYRLSYRHNGKPHFYTLQHINKYVFKDPHLVVANIAAVTTYLKKKMIDRGESPDRRVLEIIPTHEGKYIYIDEEGEYWRAYTFIDDADALNIVHTMSQMEEVGRGFGSFQKLLSDFAAEQLNETIPNFHNTTKRFYRFVNALDQDRAGRLKDVEKECEFLFQRRIMMNEIIKLTDSGTLPIRVTHNDTKANNVLLDSKTGKALCIIDLDTVMPGSVLYDYGDAIRYGASTAAEDEPDTSIIKLDMKKAEAFTRGFISETNGFLSDEELFRLPLGIKVMTCELAMRFLTDYIDGDLYFKVRSPEHNLIRARSQMALLEDIEKKEDE
ncbi:MAG: aminoglycoside phosphotransferase family protein, partial [Eubacteriales bacterium]|nr:aminoglycoside phosphotransferase family protein [Eubacteriales bacterium]